MCFFMFAVVSFFAFVFLTPPQGGAVVLPPNSNGSHHRPKSPSSRPVYLSQKQHPYLPPGGAHSPRSGSPSRVRSISPRHNRRAHNNLSPKMPNSMVRTRPQSETCTVTWGNEGFCHQVLALLFLSVFSSSTEIRSQFHNPTLREALPCR